MAQSGTIFAGYSVSFDHEVLENFISGLGVWGPVVFFLLQVIQAIIAPIPGNLLTMVGGALFGIWPGFLLAYTANVVGSIIGFLTVRKAGRVVLAKLVGPRRFDRYLSLIGTESATSRTKILLILVVLLPFLPSDFMCLAVGVTAISFRAFIIIVIICRPWGQLAAVLLGVGAMKIPTGILIPSIIVMIGVCVIAVRFAPRLELSALKWARKLTNKHFETCQ